MKKIFYFLAGFALFCVQSFVVAQQPGYLDGSFGTNGIVLASFATPSVAVLESSVLQQDGKIVAVGYVTSSSLGTVGCIARFLPDGENDPDFGANGWLFYDFGTDYNVFRDIVIQPDGKYVVVGNSGNAGEDWLLISRLNQNGDYDFSFGDSGHTHVDLGIYTIGYSVALQSDGKIVAAGYTEDGGVTGRDAAIVRLNTDGTLDNTFTSDGSLILDLNGNSDDILRGIAIVDDKILVAGIALNGNSTNYDAIVLAKIKSDGLLDVSFGVNGISKYDDVNQENMFVEPSTEMIVTQDGKIVVATYKTGLAGDDIAVLRFLSNGYPDNSFGDFGLVVTHLVADSKAYSLAEQSDGKIVVAGGFNNQRFLVLRYLDSGDPDESFGNSSGMSVFDIGGTDDETAKSVFIQPDGKIVVGGYAFISSNESDFAVIRLYSGLETFTKENSSEDFEMDVYPNPAGTDFTVKYTLDRKEKITISLLTTNGEVVDEFFTGVKESGVHNENVIVQPCIPSGIYFIRVSTREKVLFSKFVIIKK